MYLYRVLCIVCLCFLLFVLCVVTVILFPLLSAFMSPIFLCLSLSVSLCLSLSLSLSVSLSLCLSLSLSVSVSLSLCLSLSLPLLFPLQLVSLGVGSSGISELIVAIGRSRDQYNLNERLVSHLDALLQIENPGGGERGKQEEL